MSQVRFGKFAWAVDVIVNIGPLQHVVYVNQLNCTHKLTVEAESGLM